MLRFQELDFEMRLLTSEKYSQIILLFFQKYESSKFADTLGGIWSSIDIMDRENRIKDSAEVKAQTAIQEKMLWQLAVIASKNFWSSSILESVANIFHPTGTTAQWNWKIPALNTTVKSK